MERYLEELSAFVLQQHGAGSVGAEVIRNMGKTEQIFYHLKTEYANLDTSEVCSLKLLEDEK